MKKVGIVMGSDSNLPFLRKAMDTPASLAFPVSLPVFTALTHSSLRFRCLPESRLLL